MDFKQAQKHNEQVSEKIKILQSDFVYKMRVRVVERLSDGRREAVVDTTTEYVKTSDVQMFYKDYRALYADEKKFFVLIEPVEEVKRTVNVRLPVRTDDERQPAHGIPDPTKEQMGGGI